MTEQVNEISVLNEISKTVDSDERNQLEILEEKDNMNHKIHREYRCSEKSSYFRDKHPRHRTSLHGKALNFRNNRNDARYRRLQAKIYNFLERPKTYSSIIYHVLIFASVFMCLMLSVLSTIAKYDQIAGEALLYTELVMLFWFFTEYCLRMWSAGCRSRYQSWRGRMQFAKRPFCLVDIVVILASIVVLVIGSDRQKIAASAFRGLRFFQILRMIRMDRRGGSWKLLASVVWAHRQELFTTVYIGFLGLIFSSFLMYLVEKDSNQRINTYADALWWGVVTLCTVGYGDAVPNSWLGKIIAGCSCLCIISFYALPPGILGSGFALKVQQHQRQKHLIRRRVPAATLIQCLWRCYAADPNSTSCATWKIHMKPLRSPLSNERLTRFGRFSSIKRKKEKGSFMHSHPSNSSLYRRNAIETPALSQTNPTCEENENSTNNDVYNEDFLENSINSSRSMKKRFRALAQSMKSHMNMNAAPNESMRRSSNFMVPVEKDSAMNDEIQFINQLTEADRNVIRAVRKIKFFVARKKFREALRPYDVKDVMEQYSAGHVDMLARIKNLQSRLDLIVGQHGGKDQQIFETKISLTSRIIKVEKQVDSIETKLDFLIEMYTEDRKNNKENYSFDTSITCLSGDAEYHVTSPWITLTNNNNFLNNSQHDSSEFSEQDGFPRRSLNLKCNKDYFNKQSLCDDNSGSVSVSAEPCDINVQSNCSEELKEKLKPCKTQFFIGTNIDILPDSVETLKHSLHFPNNENTDNDIKKQCFSNDKTDFTFTDSINKSSKQNTNVTPPSNVVVPVNHDTYDHTKNIKRYTSFIGPFSDCDVWLSEIDESSECKESNSSKNASTHSSKNTKRFSKESSKFNITPEKSMRQSQEFSVTYKMKPESQPLLIGSHVKQMKKSFC